MSPTLPHSASLLPNTNKKQTKSKMPSVIRVLAGAMLLAAPATAAFDNMGPAAFMWPPDRPWSADADNTAPCGSDSGPVNRTSFPMSMKAV